jgi:hypothetical protein
MNGAKRSAREIWFVIRALIRFTSRAVAGGLTLELTRAETPLGCSIKPSMGYPNVLTSLTLITVLAIEVDFNLPPERVVRTRRKASARLHKVFINHTQTAKLHVLGIEIISERKRVISIKSSEIEMAALFCFVNRDHVSYMPDKLHQFVANVFFVLCDKLKFVGHREKHFNQLIQSLRILVVKSSKQRTVEIQNAKQLVFAD